MSFNVSGTVAFVSGANRGIGKSIVETLIERDHAYVASDGVVYFDVQSFTEYGRLSGNKVEDLEANVARTRDVIRGCRDQTVP